MDAKRGGRPLSERELVMRAGRRCAPMANSGGLLIGRVGTLSRSSFWILAILLWGCLRVAPSRAEDKDPGSEDGSRTLTIGVREWPPIHNPLESESGNHVLSRLVFEPPLTFDRQLNLDIERSLVRAFRVLGDDPEYASGGEALTLSDGTSIEPDFAFELDLKENIVFSDGTILSPELAIASLERMNQLLKSRLPAKLRIEIVKVKSHTLRFLLSEKWGPYLTLLGSSWAGLNFEGRSGLVGTGAFKVTPVADGGDALDQEGTAGGDLVGDKIVLDLNEYATRRPAGIDRIVLSQAPSGFSATARLLAGRLICLADPVESEWMRFEGLNGFERQESISTTFIYLLFCRNGTWVRYPRFREAVALGLDSRQFSKAVKRSSFIPLTGAFPSDLVDAERSRDRYQRNSLQSIEQLRLEGVPAGGHILRVALDARWSKVDFDPETLENALDRTLAPINMSAALVQGSGSIRPDLTSEDMAEALLVPITAPWMDPHFFVAPFFDDSGGLETFSSLVDPQLESEATKASASLTNIRRQFLYSELAYHLSTIYPLTLLGAQANRWIVSSRLKGALIQFDGSLDLKKAVLLPIAP